MTRQSRVDGGTEHGLLRRQEPPHNDEKKQVLSKFIKNIIQLNGAISIEAYWNLCLAHPEYGYYMKSDPLGEAGDFTTAPEISQLFGEMIGIWAIEQWQKLGSPDAIYIVECGPGRGTLMADLLRIGKVIPEFIRAVQIHLIETSPLLRTKQGAALKGYQVVWHEDLSTLPDIAPLIVIGNEFLDALPIKQYVFKDGAWFERVVGCDGDKLIFGLCPTASQLIPLAEGQGNDFIFEASPARENFIDDISKRVKIQSGAALMIDYGFEVSDFKNTFQAVKKHSYADVLKDCGDVDLTSHVDFGQLKSVAEQHGVSVAVQSQVDFLKRWGIEARAAQLMQKSPLIESGLHRLIDDDKMGQLFKVMEIIS